MFALIALASAARIDASLPSVGTTELMVALDPPEGSPLDPERWRADIRRQQARALACAPGAEVLHRYSSVPMLHLRGDSRVIQQLAACPGVHSIGPNGEAYAQLAESVPMIGASTWHSAGWDGSGGAVAVIDSGVDYRLPELGGCLGNGCKVMGEDLADHDQDPQDCDGHGSNVAAIAAGTDGVAPGASVIALKVFPDNNCYNTDFATIASALDWTVTHQQEYGIVAVNLSVGGTTLYDSPCDDVETGYNAAIDAVAAAGMLMVVSAGNQVSPDFVNYPACLRNAFPVTAVYDGDVGPIYWTNCTDLTTYSDKVACFANGGPMVAMAAPGAMIDAAGYQMGGTSQAAPHVAGAAALLAQAYPGVDGGTLGLWMEAAGTPIVDPRTPKAWTYPRLSLNSLLPGEPKIAVDGSHFSRETLGPGEVSVLELSLRNDGDGDAQSVTATVSTQAPLATVVASSSVATLPAGATMPLPPLVLQAQTCNKGQVVPVNVQVQDILGNQANALLQLTVTCPPPDTDLHVDTAGETGEDSESADPTPPDGKKDEGCGCASAPTTDAWFLAVLGGWMGWRRRKR